MPRTSRSARRVSARGRAVVPDSPARPAALEPLEGRRLLAATVVDFEPLVGPVAGANGVYDAPGGYRFTDRQSNTVIDPGGPRLYGPADGFASKVIQPANFGQRIVLTRPDNAPFDLAGFSYAASVYGDNGDFSAVGYFADGTAQATNRAFSRSKAQQELTLNWTGLNRVVVDFNGGVNGAYGTLDNFRLNAGPAAPTAGSAQVTGSLANADPLAGPLGVQFNGPTGEKIGVIAPLPDGRFYTFGRSNGGASSYAVRHFADGQIDRTFGTDGRRDVTGDVGLRSAAGGDVRVFPIAGGGFLFRADVLRRYDADLNAVAAYGINGGLPANFLGNYDVAPDGSVVALVGTPATGTWRRFDANGQFVAETPVTGVSGFTDGHNKAYVFNGRFAVANDAVYVLLVGNNGIGYDAGFYAIRKLDANFQPVSDYGTGGLNVFQRQQGEGHLVAYFDAAPDGRTIFGTDDGDHDVSLEVQLGDGRTTVGGFSRSGYTTERDYTIRDVAFNDGGVTVIYSATAGRSGPGFSTPPIVLGVERSGTQGGPNSTLEIVPGTNGFSGDFRPGDVEFAAGGQVLFTADSLAAPQVYRFNPRGTFGTDGRKLLSFAGFNYVRVDQSVPTPEGGVFVIGRRGNFTNFGMPLPGGGSTPVAPAAQTFVAKLKADGSLDMTFSGDGVASPAELDLPYGGRLVGLKAFPGGGYLAALGDPAAFVGSSSDSVNQRFGDRMVKLTAGFRPDASFGGGDGVAETGAFGVFDVRADGKILFANSTRDGTNYVELYDADGSLVSGSRRTVQSLVGRNLRVTDVSAGDNNSTFVTFDYFIDSSNPNFDLKAFDLIKLTPSLSLDTRFATNGVKTARYSTIDFLVPTGIIAGPQGQTLWVFTEDDAQTSVIASDANGMSLPNFDFRFDTLGVLSDGLSYNPNVLDAGYAADGGFTLAVEYHTYSTNVFYSDNPFDGANAFSLSKYNADGTPDASFGPNGVKTIFNGERPIIVADADYAGDGKFFLAGADDNSTFATQDGTRVITAFGLNGSVRLIDVDGPGGGTAAPAVVDFESAPLGPTAAAGYTDPSGFRFTSVGGQSLAGGAPLLVYGPANGFASKVIQPANYGRAVSVKRPDGGAFDLQSFDLAASVYGDNGDVTVTGRTAAGASRSFNAAFSRSKTPVTIPANLAGVTEVLINFAGGVNDAFGTLDNFRFAAAANPTPTPAGDGLRATYFDNKDFTGPVLTRVDASVDFNFADGSPAANVGPDTFSIRWTGRVVAPAAGQYVFRTYADDGTRLTLNGGRVIDDLTDHAPHYATSPTFTYTAGQSLSLQLDYYENFGGALVRLEWKRPGDAGFSVVPTSALFSA